MKFRATEEVENTETPHPVRGAWVEITKRGYYTAAEAGRTP